MERPPLVKDLMAEVETKSRVTILNQQLLYRGTRNLFQKKVKFEKMLL